MMKKINFIYILALLFLFSCSQNSSSDKGKKENKDEINLSEFVQVKDGRFVLNGKDYTFVGTNFWYGGNLAAQGEEGKGRLKRELDKLSEIGISNLRIQICSEGGDEIQFGVKPSLQPKQGEFNEEVFKGIDYLLNEMALRNIKGVLVLNNYWSWTGGMAKYQNWNGAGDIPYPSSGKLGSWDTYMKYAAGFYENEAAVKANLHTIKTVIERKNTVNGVLYREDPTIMSWQLANEPRGKEGREKQDVLINWIDQTAKYIKSIDSLHLISVGSEGKISHFMKIEDYKKAHESDYIDYCTAHMWPQNWGWFNPEKAEETIEESQKKATDYIEEHLAVAKELNKPITLEEFGLARDNGSYELSSTTKYRDQFFELIFNYVAKSMGTSTLGGSNFWSWGGEGIPPRPGQMWEKGDPLIGDPPHEAQAWYSVFNSDTTTINIIQKYKQN